MTAGPYEALLADVLENGEFKGDRTGTGTLSVFGRHFRYNLSEAFPLITSKRVPFKHVAIELEWFLKGMTNVRWLQERGVKIWNQWADADGELGPVYGSQWRMWPSVTGEPIDQIANVIESIRTNPDSRRHVVSAWNPDEVENMALPPCHALFQFYVSNGKLSCQLYQRSADMFLGVPFNIASYSLLTHMIARQCELEVGDFVWSGGDVHIYINHIEQVEEQLSRAPRPLPQLSIIQQHEDISDYTFEDFDVQNYDPHPTIRGAIAV